MKKINILSILILMIVANSLKSEVVEKICAIVNDEIITFSDLQRREMGLYQRLKGQFNGDQLKEEFTKQKKELLDTLINEKLLLSTAKAKAYDVDKDVEMIIGEIKKRNNMKTDNDLIKALTNEGIEYEDFLQMQKNNRMTQRLIYEEITAKIKTDTSQIMEYYRSHNAEFMIKKQITINCIFLNKTNYISDDTLNTKKLAILSQITPSNFKEMALKHTETEGKGEERILLGTFKLGELDQTIEKPALSLEPGAHHPEWIDSDSGSYLIQLKDSTPQRLKPYKDVSDQIDAKIKQEKTMVKMKDYLKELHSTSFVKIYK